MKIILIQVLLPLATYAIGVMIGVRIGWKSAYAHIKKIIQEEFGSELDELKELVDPEDLQHVGYSEAECGYDK